MDSEPENELKRDSIWKHPLARHYTREFFGSLFWFGLFLLVICNYALIRHLLTGYDINVGHVLLLEAAGLFLMLVGMWASRTLPG